jgi:predicted ATPase/DNA-binding SARP family transcriptional activator/pimeloyl-ACP methyl ester carboxylesterase
MLKFFLLGPPRIELDETPIDINRRKALALLIYLAVNEKPYSRDALATLFYPDHTQQRARAYLRRDLAVLNTSLGGDWLLADRERVELKQDAQLWSDVTEFHNLLNMVRTHDHTSEANCTDYLNRLSEAAALYTDDFLAGFTLRDSPEFDDWQFFQAEGLRQELNSVLEQLVRGLSQQGSYEAAIPHGRRWLALDPLHEPVHRVLMRLYAESGQQSAALRQYEECVRLLAEEFGVAPDEETTTLYEAIKAKRLIAPLLKKAEEQRHEPEDRLETKSIISVSPPTSSHQVTPSATPLVARPFAPVDQQIRLTTSADGTRIAYAVVGNGPPLVKVANPLTHLQYDWESPVWRHWIEELSRNHMLVRYDERGCGLSDRRVTNFSVDAWVNDLEAVVDDLRLARFPIIGMSQGASIAVAYAVRHPEKVSQLILYGGYARGRFNRDLTPEQHLETETLLNLIRVGWGQDDPAFRQIFAATFMPEGVPHQHEWFNDLARITADPETAATMERAFYHIDVTNLAPQVAVPTLVLHPLQDAMCPFAEGRLLADLIPKARFVPLDSKNHVLQEDEPAWQQFLSEVRRFLQQDTPTQPSSPGDSGSVWSGRVGGQDVATTPIVEPQAIPAAPKRDQIADVTPHIPFIGRDSEYRQMVSALDLATRGQSQVMLVEGESGIGKSRLVEEVRRYARRHGINTLSGKCYEAEQSLPYQVVIQLVDQALKQWPPEMLRRLSPTYLAEIARLVPEVAHHFPDLPPPSDLKEAQQSRLFRALFQFMGLLAEQSGLMLVVDDIQWADRITQQFLNYLVCHFETDPMLLVGIYRSEEMATDRELTALVQAWQHEPNGNQLRLDRLTRDDATALVEQFLQASPQAETLGEWLHQETDGHPFFLVSILQSLGERGVLTRTGEAAWQIDTQQLGRGELDLMLPDALRQSVHSRLRHLPKATKSVIDLAAVYGRHFDFPMLQAITQVDQSELLDILEDLVARQLWREVESGRSYDFSHDKIREVVYHDLSGIRRVILHREVAEAAEQLTAGKRVGLLAEHFEKGEVWDEAVIYLSRAAEKATTLFAMGEAIDFYNRAIKIVESKPDLVDELTKFRLYERRGEARTFAGQLAGGIADLEQVLQFAKTLNNQTWKRALLTELGHACRKADRLENAIQYLTDALTMARRADDELVIADILYHLGTTSYSAGEYNQSAKYHQEAVDICARLGNIDLVAVQAYHGRGEAYFSTGHATAAIEYYEKSLEMARQIQNKNYEAENLQMLGYAHLGSVGIGDYKRSLNSFTESLTISQTLGLDWLNWVSFSGWAYALGCTGDYAQALEKLEGHIEQLEAIQDAPRYLTLAYDLFGDLLRDLNLLDQAAAAHARGLEVASEVRVHFWYPRLQANLAIDRLRGGDLTVEEDLLAALTSTAKGGAVYHEVRCLEGLAEVYLALGKPEAALEHADYLLAAATPGGARELLAQAFRWRAEALLQLDDYQAAETALQQAANLEREIGRPRLAWDIHDTLARLHRQKGDHAAADNHEAQVKQIVAALATNLKEEKWRVGLR